MSDKEKFEKLPVGMPQWMRDHVELYLSDPEKAHLWDSTIGGGPGPLPTLLLIARGALSEDDARLLLKHAIQVYRKEHRTSPARLVVHKTSSVSNNEAAGFRAAADEHQIDLVELLSVRRSLTSLFLEGTYPPLRGTFLTLGQSTGLLYLRGSVQFFETYPGMCVPRPFEFSVACGETTLDQFAREILSLSKLNWNNTQFDGGEPITVRAARRVGDILKCVPEGGLVQSSFRFYM